MNLYLVALHTGQHLRLTLTITSVAIDLQGMIGEGHVGFARDELGCMFDSVCTT